MTWKPQDYTSVSPYLLVPDAEATMVFLEAVFDAKRLRVMPRAGGQGTAHAEVRIADSIVMLGETPDATPSHVHVYVPDAAACFDRAIAAGGTVVQPLQRAEDGDLRGGVDDGAGTVWWISTAG